MLHLHTLLYHTIIILSIVGLLFQPVLAIAQELQEPIKPIGLSSTPKLPETLDETGDFILRVLKLAPQALIAVFKETGGILHQNVEWLWAQWDRYVWNWIQGLWQNFLDFIGQEFEKRKPLYKKELEKQKQEIQQETYEQVEKAGKGLWERFKELIKSKL